MRLVAALLLLVACDAGAKKPVPSTSELGSAAPAVAPPVDAVVALPGDAISQAQPAPCAAETVGATGNPAPVRIAPLDECDVKWFALSELHNKRPKPGAAGPRFVEASHELWAIETRSAKELDKYAFCEKAPAIDWKRDRAWVIVYVAPDGDVSPEAAYDDGTKQTFALALLDRRGCGGRHPVTAFGFAIVLVPNDRTIALARCAGATNSCTGNEK